MIAICFNGASSELHDLSTHRLVALQLEVLECLGASLNERDAAASDDALLDSRLGVADSVLDAVLPLLQLHLGGCTDLDHRDAAGQLGQPLLQLLTVVVGVRVLDLGANLVDPAGDLLGLPAPSMIVVSSLVMIT